MSLADDPGNQTHSVADEGLSLDRLSEAFAAMLAGGADPYAPLADAQSDPLLAAAQEAKSSLPDSDEQFEVSPRSILEAILFVGAPDNRPLTSQEIASQMRGVRPAEIDDLVNDLNATYSANNCPYTILTQGAGYRLSLLERYAAVGEKLRGRIRSARLSPAAIEVLAVVAYNESLTADEVSRLRGTLSGPILSQLVRRQLLRIDRPADAPRAARYYTTSRFLNLFGLDSLADLPRSQELER